MTLQGKTAVVTGGGRGIGRAIALALAAEGADVIITARTAGEIEDVAAEIKALGPQGTAITADLGKRENVAGFVCEVRETVPLVHILVNNAGLGSGLNPRLVAEYDDDFWDLLLFVNLTAPYLLSKAFLPAMIDNGWGRIINISSIIGKQGMSHGAAYAASKHGLIGLTRTAALETATTGVTVNAICPGPIRTAMLERRIRFQAENTGTTVEEVERNFNPMQRLLEPGEVAALAVHLASDKARSITGQAYTISGGSLMH